MGYFSYDYIKYSEPTLQLDAVEEIEALAPTHIILSPGPGKPSDAGICEDVSRAFGGKVPILGICLGHQAICEVMAVEHTEYPVYGVQFHPESVLTPEGRQIMENFLRAGDLK